MMSRVRPDGLLPGEERWLPDREIILEIARVKGDINILRNQIRSWDLRLNSLTRRVMAGDPSVVKPEFARKRHD